MGGADARIYGVKQDWGVLQTFTDLPQQVRSMHSHPLLVVHTACTAGEQQGGSVRVCDAAPVLLSPNCSPDDKGVAESLTSGCRGHSPSSSAPTQGRCTWARAITT